MRRNITKMIEDFVKIFRKKEYYITNYKTLDAYHIHFKVVNEDELTKIKNVLLEFNEAHSVDDDQLHLFSKDALQFSDINNVMHEVKKIINQDYHETYFEAVNENWDFNYYLSDSDTDKQTLMVKNELRKDGAVVYALLAIRKFNNQYYLWNLLE